MNDGRLAPDDILGVVEDVLLDGDIAPYVRVNAAKLLLQAHNDASNQDDATESARDFVASLTGNDDGGDSDD